MRIDTTHSLPTLLMISDCLPDPDGGSRASRAWRLLCCAASTHRVSLSIQTDKPVNLQKWRRVAKVARRVHIESNKANLFGSPSLLHGPSVHTPHQRFDTVLLTSPELWPSQNRVVAEHRLCDFTVARETPMQTASRNTGLIARLTRGLLRRPNPVSRSAVASACDRLLVADAHQKERLPRGRSRATVIADTGQMEDWQRMFTDLHMTQNSLIEDYLAPEVKVMHVQPRSSRKAA